MEKMKQHIKYFDYICTVILNRRSNQRILNRRSNQRYNAIEWHRRIRIETSHDIKTDKLASYINKKKDL